MAPPKNINIFYFYLMSLLCSFSVTATSSWIAHIPLRWWPFLIPVLFVLVILSASGYGFLQSNSKVGYMLTENAPIDPGQDPNHNVPHVTPSPLEHSTVDYRHTSGYEDERGAVVTMAGTDEIEIEEIMFEETSEDDTEQREKYEENIGGTECLKDEQKRNRITLEMLLLAQAKFERKQEAYTHKKRRKIKRVRALGSFLRCFSLS